MKEILTKMEIRLSKYGFNKRALTDADFYRICEAEKIKILEIDSPTSFYFSCEGRFHIVIEKKLKGLKRTFSMFHELGHHFMHGGDAMPHAFFFRMTANRNELEADAFATAALCPIAELNGFDFLEHHPNRFAKKLYDDRKKLKFLYRF